jgi:hypothetical protein
MSSGSALSRRDVLSQISDEFERIFSALEPLSRAFADLLNSTPAAGREDLAGLRGTIFDVLDSHRGLLAGVGAVVAPDTLVDSRFWLEWWWTRTSGVHEALRVNLDPAAPDFFDYTCADWYLAPMRSSARHVAGPYVDYACTNEYALTVATPVTARGRFVGVAAADVLVSSLERRVMPALRRLTRPVLLLNASGRVVASASPHFAPGMRVPLPGARLRTSLRTTRRDPQRPGMQGPAIDWHLVSEPTSG